MKPRALVFKGEHYGTLAAIRTLGSMGVEVILADSKPVTPGAFSRFMAKRVDCPDFEDTEAFLSWMDDFGAKHPGCFLYPVSDLSCYIFASHGDRLRRNFNLWYPGIGTVRQILMKPLLNAAARSVGIAAPETWQPSSIKDVESIASGPDLDGYVIKPRTQLGQSVPHKGFIVKSGRDLARAWEDFRSRYPSTPIAGLVEGNDILPMIQRYISSSQDAVFSVAGFMSEDGAVFEMRGAVKTLQKPARMGIGMCFESYDLSPELVEKVRQLCKAIGYWGIFEAEFLMGPGEEPMIIDFNGRYYSQISFDIKRGMDAIRFMFNKKQELISSSVMPNAKFRYALSWYLLLVICTQALLFRLGFVVKWGAWLIAGRGVFVDKVAQLSDPMPLFCDMYAQIRHWIRHPRSSLRTLFDI